MVTTITDKEFEEAIKSHKRVAIKYYADWCGTCRLISPKFKALSEKEPYIDIHFIEMNAETNPAARKWSKVTNLPYFAVVKDGVLVDASSTGKEEKIIELLDKISL
jgi:thioredoxin 1